MTEKDCREYEVLRGDVCPNCGSGDVTGGQFTVEAEIVYQGCRCEACDARFVVVYRVQHIKMIDPPQKAKSDG